jgi:hypothetical protein
VKKLKLKLIYDLQSVGQSVLVSGSRLSTWPGFCFQPDDCGFLDVGHPLWREDGSVIYSYNCFLTLPEQSFLGRRLAELTVIFYCLIWDFPNLVCQDPVFISPRNRIAQLHPWALELMAYYNLIRHGPHRKRRIHQFLYFCSLKSESSDRVLA